MGETLTFVDGETLTWYFADRSVVTSLPRLPATLRSRCELQASPGRACFPTCRNIPPMSRNWVNVPSRWFQGRSQMREIRKPLRVALQRLESAYPYPRLVTAAPWLCDGFLANGYGKPLGALSQLRIAHRNDAYAVSLRSAPALKLGSAPLQTAFSCTILVTRRNCRQFFSRRSPILSIVCRSLRMTSLRSCSGSRPCQARAA